MNYIKLLAFIYKNRKDIISEKGLLDKETRNFIKAILACKKIDGLTWDDKKKLILIESFIESNRVLKANTPLFIRENLECIKSSIKRNINSVNYVKFEFLSVDARNKIVSEIIKTNYILSEESPNYLTTNSSVILNSLKHDKNSVKYVSDYVLGKKEIYKAIALNDYDFKEDDIIFKNLTYFDDINVLEKSLKKINFFKKYPDEILKKFAKLYFDAINISPSIDRFNSIFNYIAEKEWQKNIEADNSYNNIHGRICAELKNVNSFDEVFKNLYFLEDMEEVLSNRYSALYNSMKEYFNIYHSNEENKLKKLEPYKEIIVKLSALYVSLCKDDHKKQSMDLYKKYIKKYYTLDLNNSFVYKKVIQTNQKETFRKLYIDGDEDTLNFINSLKEKYKNSCDDFILDIMINRFIKSRISKLDEIIEAPSCYTQYKRYQKALKLINRLNLGYIKYDGVETFNYRDIIGYDDKSCKYIYTGMTFGASYIEELEKYKQKELIFENLKRDIIGKINTIYIDDKITKEKLEELSYEIPFNSKNFKFDKDKFLKETTLCELLDILITKDEFNLNIFEDNKLYSYIYNLLINNGMIWLLSLLQYLVYMEFTINGINKKNVVNLINNIDDLDKKASLLNLDLNKFDELFLAYELTKKCDSSTLAILGTDIVSKISKDTSYTYHDFEEILRMSKELVCNMTKRNKSTVPYVSGSTMNYKYSIYDPLDESLLVSGHDTDSCFRVDGNDHDFLHYCALDKNGFAIKITDSLGNFIGRAAGFRHGNSLYINQLRTIYDMGGNNYTGNFESEKNEVIKTFEMACKDIFNTSQNNKEEDLKIDFVFVNKCYCLDNCHSNLLSKIENKIIDNKPMDTESADWYKFLESTDNLTDALAMDDFTTDYGEYEIICMASIKDTYDIEPEDIKYYNAPALYERKRNKIIISTNADKNIYHKVNKINAVKSFFDKTEFVPILIPDNSTTYVGDNWYIIYNNGQIIDSCLLDFDEKAKTEFEATKHVINQNNEQILQETEGHKKVSKIN